MVEVIFYWLERDEVIIARFIPDSTKSAISCSLCILEEIVNARKSGVSLRDLGTLVYIGTVE